MKIFHVIDNRRFGALVGPSISFLRAMDLQMSTKATVIVYSYGYGYGLLAVSPESCALRELWKQQMPLDGSASAMVNYGRGF